MVYFLRALPKIVVKGIAFRLPLERTRHVGVVFDIQRFCLHDGPGLRTTVFLKGCPLACRWCSNPESQRFEPELFFNAARCMRCGGCVEACPRSAILRRADGSIAIDRDRCLVCGACEAVCPMGALVRKGREMTAAEVLREVERDRSFYETSGGGATVSGGEPFGQPDFLHELLAEFKAAGISTAVETSLYAEWRDIAPRLPLLDNLLVDVKHPDSARHEEWTGVGLGQIRRNLEYLLAGHDRVLVRIPVIPGCNTDPASLEGFAELFGDLGVRRVELLPYHVLGEGKYRMLDRGYPGESIQTAEADGAAERLAEFLCGRGVEAEIGG